MSSIAANRPEPAGIAVMDLIALVIGAAVAVALPWQTIGSAGRWFSQREGRFLFQFLAEAAQRACLALVPVVLARRARFGGVARPAEFLAAICGLPPLVRAAEHLLFVLRVGFDPWLRPQGLADEELLRRDEVWNHWQDAMYWPWTMGMLTLAFGCLCALALAPSRLRWSGWLQTILLLFAWLGLARFVWAVAARLFPFENLANATAAGAVFGYVGFFAAGMLPFKLLFDVPAGAAWYRIRSEHARRPNWLEWLGLGLVATLFVATWGQRAHGAFMTPLPPGFWAEEIGFLATTAGAIALGLMVARRFLRAWSGLDAADDSDRGAELHPTSGT